MATLKDISNLSGVSLATVSRVMNKSGAVKESTRICVENAIKQLNYSPNMSARSLRTKSTKLLGISTEGNTNYMFSHLINYISDFCLEKEYNLIVSNHHNDPEFELKIFNSLRQQGVDGIIVSLVSKRSRIIPAIVDSDIPVVIFDRYLLFDQMSMGKNNFSIVLDNYKAGKLAAKHLKDLGHTKIAIAEGPSNVDITRIRTNGFYDELAESDHFVPQMYRFRGGFEFEDGCDIADKILALNDNMPTAVWAHNDMMAAGIECELTKAGLKIPDDISVIGMDGIELSRLVYPSLTTVSQPFEEMARTAVNMLLDTGQTGNKRAVFEPSLLIRESTAPPKK